MIVAQVRAVAEDIGVDAVKIGMLGTAETVEAVVEALGLVGEAPVVIDPVMVAESGAVLLDDEARRALVERLLPLAAVATPNIPEARELTGLGEGASQEELAAGSWRSGPQAVVVTGGHSEELVDLFFDGERAGRDPRRAPPRRRRARLRLHPLLGARRLSRPRRRAAARRPAGAADRLRGGRRRPARDRRRARPSRRLRARSQHRCGRRRKLELAARRPVDFPHELERRHHDRPPAPPLRHRLRRPRPRPLARLHEGDRLRRRRAQPADDRDRQHLDRGDALQLPPARRWPSTSRRACAPPAARRWSSTPSPSPTG